MRTYYELLTMNKDMLTYDEKKQLERAERIPPSARTACESRLTRITAEIVKLEEERDELADFLNGIEYDPNAKVPF